MSRQRWIEPLTEFQCRDDLRLLLNGTIQPFQEEKRVVGFFWTYRKLYPISRDVLRNIATQFQNWVQNRSQKWTVPIIKDSDDPEARRDKMLDSYFKGAKEDRVVCITDDYSLASLRYDLSKLRFGLILPRRSESLCALD